MCFLLYILLFQWSISLIIQSCNETIVDHTFSSFGPSFDYSTNITGQLVSAKPLTVCGITDANYTNKIILAERYGEDTSCPYDLQVLTLQKHGAKAVIIMDSEDRENMLWLSSSDFNISHQISIISIYITYRSGLLLLDYLSLYPNLTVIINEIGEYTLTTNELNRFIYLNVVCIVGILWMCTGLLFSDKSIIRRLMNKQKKLYNRIAPVVYRKSTKQLPKSPIAIPLWGPRTLDSANASFLEENRDSCPICLCEFQDFDIIKMLPCKHFFHKDCIDPWFLKEGSCPVCKQSLASTTSMYHNIDYINSEFVKAICKDNIQRKVNTFWKYTFFIVILSAFFFL